MLLAVHVPGVNLDDDPGELENLARKKPIARRGCEIYLWEGLHIRKKSERLTGMQTSPTYEAPDAKVDPALLEHLKALGYFNN